MANERRLLITAGPTREPLDPVRFVGNRSSGRLGLCLAEAARDAGWTVTLLLGPVCAAPPAAIRTLPFESTEELTTLLKQEFPQCDVLIMAAAVADYRPSKPAEHKLVRTGMKLVIELEPTPDLVAECAARRRPHQRIVGFALEESARLHERAQDKLRRKRLDAIIANPLDTIGAERIGATVYTADGAALTPGGEGAAPLTKADFARWLIDWLDATAAPPDA